MAYLLRAVERETVLTYLKDSIFAFKGLEKTTEDFSQVRRCPGGD
jgi:hypothetical protein